MGAWIPSGQTFLQKLPEKEEEAQRLQRLEEAVREAQEREKNLEARM